MTTTSGANDAPATSWTDASADALAHAHARLLDLANNLADAGGPAIMRRTLEAMRPLLAAHFADEERPGGFYADVRRARPWLAPRIRSLAGQHVTMLGAVDGLLQELADAPTPFPPHQVARDELVALLKQHEYDESELVNEAWWRDLGEGD